MAGISEEELRRPVDTLSVSERPLTAGGSELASGQQVAKVAVVTVDLRDGFRNEPRSPEYRAIHGLPPDTNDTHEDWIQRLHPEAARALFSTLSMQ